MTNNDPIKTKRNDGSSGNAVTHGLTSKKLLPKKLRLQTAQLRDQLAEELFPATVLESILVDELARHAAALKFTSRAEPAVLRCGAACEPHLAAMMGLQTAAPVDIRLLGAITSEGLDKVSRYRRAHERGFYSALERLTTLRSGHATSFLRVLRERFATECACRAYLLARLQTLSCPRCGFAGGLWIARRERRECRECKLQVGIRAATIMEHSPLPLTCWFAAILATIANPAVTVTELARVTGIERLATVRGMLSKIRSAESRPPAEAERLLAGLPQLCGRSSS